MLHLALLVVIHPHVVHPHVFIRLNWSVFMAMTGNLRWAGRERNSREWIEGRDKGGLLSQGIGRVAVRQGNPHASAGTAGKQDQGSCKGI